MDEVAVAQHEHEWIDLRGADGKIKARLNRLTGVLIIKERQIYHHWSLLPMMQDGKTVDINLTSC